MMEQAPLGIALYNAQDFSLLEANTRYLALLDTFLDPSWRGGRVTGHTLSEFGASLTELGNIQVFRYVAETGISYRGEAVALTTPQGQHTLWNWTLDAVRDDNGHIIHLLQTISEAPANQASRREERRHPAGINVSEMQLHTLLDQLPEGILIADILNGSISYANPAAAHLLDLPLAQLSGSQIHQFTSRQIAAEREIGNSRLTPWNFFLIQALSGETMKSRETVIIRPDGSKVVALISGAPLYTKHAQSHVMTGAVIVFQDITAQKSIEQHKNEFLSIASHELRTPITVIQGFSELLQLKEKEEGLSEFSRSAIAHIADQSDHLSRLIGAMLDLSRLEQAQFDLNMAPHDLRALLVSIVRSQEVTTLNHRLRLVLEGLREEELLAGVFDRERIKQVLGNLINNAVKYSPDGGEIEVGLRAIANPRRPNEYREMLLWVKDQGIGIEPDEIPHIFERFYRASRLDRSFSGFGIGLYIVKEIVIRHGGRIWVESQKGAGSVFYVSLPLVHVGE